MDALHLARVLSIPERHSPRPLAVPLLRNTGKRDGQKPPGMTELDWVRREGRRLRAQRGPPLERATGTLSWRSDPT